MSIKEQPKGKSCKICGLKGKEKERFHKMLKNLDQWDEIIKKL